MNQNMTQTITRTGLLLAATLLLQGLRLLIPVPPQVSMFLIGALVNACLIIAVLTVNWRAGVVVACVTPCFAWLEGMLPLPPFIVPIALGNTVFVSVAYLLRQWRSTSYYGVYCAAVAKTIVLYGLFYGLFSFVEFPAAIRHVMLFSMSWPQLWNGFLGGTLGVLISHRLARYH